jgi:uncharacterized protein (DUF2336 family)
MGFFSRILGLDARRYERQKMLLASGTPQQRLKMAGDTATHPEALYYLANDADPDIRRAVAENSATPIQASALLAKDNSTDVRLALAARLVSLLPELGPEKHSQLYAYAVQALGVLAQDEVLLIRRALASALKDHAKAPPKVAGQLARDVEREVSEPILRFCIALADEDLLQILADHPEPWAISAIAGRPAVSAAVSEAIIGTGDVPAGGALIRNRGATLSEETLREIIDRAREYPEWHEPVALRQELSLELARKLAGFASGAVLAALERRKDFDPATRQEIAAIVERRIAFRQAPEETPEAKVSRYAQEGRLSAEVVQDALAWQDNRFVLLALTQLSGIHPLVVEKMLGAGSAKPVIALCWKAGLPMRVALELQRSYAKLHPRDFINPKGGTDYPLSPEEIKWQLEFYGVKDANYGIKKTI